MAWRRAEAGLGQGTDEAEEGFTILLMVFALFSFAVKKRVAAAGFRVYAI